MPTLMQTGATWLGARLKESNGQAVTVTQGAFVLSLTASLTTNEDDVADADGFLTHIQSYDWTFVTADLGTVKLRAGALVRDASGNEYEAMPVGQKPAVDGLDASRILTVVRTKQVNSV